MREAFAIAASGRPGPVLIDITKDAQLGTLRVRLGRRRAAISSRWPRPGHSSGVDPLALDQRRRAAADPRRPRHHARRRRSGAARLAEKASIPVAMTLLGIGGFPASHPLNLGMMGMHGEAWVNTAIQEADLLIALGMRFDDRVTGNLKTYAPNARKIHVDIDPAEINKNVARRRRPSPATSATCSATWLPQRRPRRSREVARRTSPS